MSIRTSRYVIRDFVELDRPAFLAYQLDPGYRRLYDYPAGDVGRPNDLLDLFLNWQESDPRRDYQFGIFDRADGSLLGSAGLRLSGREPGDAVYGIELSPANWGRYRLAIEVTSAMIEFGFGTLALDTITGDTSSGNRRIEKLSRWFGATRVASREGPGWMQRRGWHEVDWKLRREDWRPPPPGRRVGSENGAAGED